MTAMMARLNGCERWRGWEPGVGVVGKAGLFTLRSWGGTPQYGKMRASDRCQKSGMGLAPSPAGAARDKVTQGS